jgi:hypothetical protein
VLLVESLLAGKAFSVAFDKASGALGEFLKQDALGRLLVILHTEYAEQSGLQRDAFYAWRTQQPLADALEEVLAGARGKEHAELSELAELIAPRLHYSSGEQRATLSEEMALAAVSVAPRVVGGDDTQLVLGRLEAGQQRIIQAIAAKGDEVTPAGLAGALLVGPLRLVDAVDEVRAAEADAQQGQSVQAAHTLLAIVARLKDRGLHTAAETLTERAASLLAGSEEHDNAVDLLIGVLQARIERGSRWAAGSTLRAIEALVDENSWIVPALKARIEWPEQGVAAVDALKTAAESSNGRDDHLQWVAAYTALLMLFGDSEAVLAVTASITDLPRQSGPRTMLELDRLEALAATGQERTAKDGWHELLGFLDMQGNPADRGVAWQRRGLTLAREEDLAGATDAYRRAIDAWSAAPDFEEQAGDAFLSMQSAYLLNGRAEIPDADLRPLAASLRGDSQTPVARADRLMAEGMSKRINGKLPNAMYDYWMAYELQRRAGSLSGLIESAGALAELYQHANQPAQAMMLYVVAGAGQPAAQAVSGIYPAGPILASLNLNVPRWERAAAYHVIGEHGATLPEAYVAENFQRILEEARQEPDGPFGPQPVHAARKALATVALVVPPAQREDVFDQLKEQLHGNFIDVVRASTQALILATNAGVSDATTDLLELYLEDSYNLGVHSAWIAQSASRDEQVHERLRSEALAGHAGALEALAIAELIERDEQLVSLAGAAAQRASEIETIKQSTENGQSSISASMGVGLQVPAMLARSVAGPVKERFLDRLLTILTNSGEPESNRAAAAEALFNLAPSLDDTQAVLVNSAVAPISLGSYDLSRWDENLDDPLSRFQITVHTPHVLRIAALGTSAQLVAKHPQLGIGHLAQAIEKALSDGPETVIAGALEAASRVVEIELPFAPETALSHPDARVRMAAFDVWASRHQELPGGQMLDALRRDVSTNVRLQLLTMASRSSDGAETLEWSATNDPDAYVRVLAVSYLEALATGAAASVD